MERERRMLNVWLRPHIYEALQLQAKTLGVTLTKLVQVALPLGAAQLRVADDPRQFFDPGAAGQSSERQKDTRAHESLAGDRARG